MKYLFSFLLTVCLVSFAFAASNVDEQAAEYGLNQASPNQMAKQRLGSKVVKGAVRVARAKYDFSVQGGAIGTVNLVGEDGQAVVLPSGAVVVDCLIDVITQGATSASGTLALGTGQAGNDLKAALAAASYTGLLACVPVGTAASSIKLTADRTMTGTIATGALTAGKVWVYVYYIVGGS